MRKATHQPGAYHANDGLRRPSLCHSWLLRKAKISHLHSENLSFDFPLDTSST